MCMFKHFLDVNEEDSDNEDCEKHGDDDDSQSEEYSLETFKYMDSAPCWDKHLANDKKYYWTEQEKLSEISKVKKYIQSQVMRSELI